ncbi:MAG: site-specific DNA-methyltransferase [Candidatus Diapherotrites archaeon]
MNQNSFPTHLLDSVVCGDSRQVLTQIPDDCVDLVFTSPPYNVNLGYDTYHDNLPFDVYFDFLLAVFFECFRILKPGGRLVVNIGDNIVFGVPTSAILTSKLLDKGFVWYDTIIWNKKNYSSGNFLGSWLSPSCPVIKKTYEFVIIFAKNTKKHVGNSCLSDLTKKEFLAYTNSIWEFSGESKMLEYGHPAMFPEELARRVIKLFSFVDDVVVDPFSGVGTTLFVAKSLKRHYFGVDVSKVYCEKAKQRLAQSFFDFRTGNVV